MNSGKKIALTLLITILIFAVFVFASFTSFFSLFETRFYQPAVISGMEKRLKDVSNCLDDYAMQQANYFSHFVNLPCVKTASSFTQSQEDIKNLEYYANGILENNSGLQGVRIIDTNGKKIIFSTYESDGTNYTELSELPYDTIKANEEIENRSKARIVFDNSQERIIFSIPFYDSYDLFRGSAIFYVAGIDFNRHLISKNILSVSERAKLVATVFSDSVKQSKGFVLGLPSVSSEVIIGKIIDLWNKDSFDTQKILHSQDYNLFVISDNSGKTGIISLVFKDDILIFSPELKILLLLCVFITLYLIILFIFSLKQDDQAIIREKIKKFKIALINEYLIGTGDEDWQEVTKFLAARKHQINHDIKKYLGKKATNNKILVENLLEKTWDEVEQVIIYHEKQKETEEQYEIQIEDLEAVNDLPQNGATGNSVDVIEEIEELEELEEIESIEEVEEEKESLNNSFIFNKENTGSVSDFNFEVKVPDFAILDEQSEDEFTESLEEIEELEEVEQLDQNELEEVEPVEELKELEDTEDAKLETIEDFSELEELNYVEVFSFTSGVNAKFYTSAKIEELQSLDDNSSIEETSSGIFVISNNIKTQNLSLDTNFKNLVDSVLQNNI